VDQRQRIVVAVKETMRITAEIDALIPGWYMLDILTLCLTSDGIDDPADASRIRGVGNLATRHTVPAGRAGCSGNKNSCANTELKTEIRQTPAATAREGKDVVRTCGEMCCRAFLR
jgi:hypothetical protein